MCILLEQVTHTRYDEKKETGVGDGDRELSRLPGTPPPVYIKEHKHVHTQPYTQKSKDTEKRVASVVPI